MPSSGPSVAVPARTHRRRAILLALLGAFQLWMWGTRLWNQLQSTEGVSAAFVGVHVTLFTAGIGVGIVLGVLAWRLWREAAAAQGSELTAATSR